MKTHRTRLLVAASFAVVTAVIGAEKPAAAPAKPAAPKADAAVAADVVAVVEGVEIKNTELEAALQNAMMRQGMPADAVPPEQKKEFARMLLDDMIVDKLIAKRSADVKVTDEEVNAQFEQVKGRFAGNDEEMQKQLKAAGQTVDGVKSEIRMRMKQRKWMDEQLAAKGVKDPTDAEAKEFYEKNPQHFQQPEMVRASHILLKLDPGAKDDEVAKKTAEAKKITERVNKGEDFAKLAEELSEDPGAKGRGGDLDFFPREGAMVEPFAEAAYKLKKGEVTAEPVRSQFGLHIIKATDRKEAKTVPLDEAKAKIVAYLGNQKKQAVMEEVVKGIREKADVKVNLAAPAPAPAAAPAAVPSAPVEAVTPPVSAPAPEKAPTKKK